jgi:hypothetical protein
MRKPECVFYLHCDEGELINDLQVQASQLQVRIL